MYRNMTEEKYNSLLKRGKSIFADFATQFNFNHLSDKFIRLDADKFRTEESAIEICIILALLEDDFNNSKKGRQ